MTPDSATTTSTPAPQAAAAGPQPTTPASPAAANGAVTGSQPAPAPQPAPAAQPTPVQLLWQVATLAFELMRRLVNVLQPIQQYYPKQALLLARLLIDIPRIFLTIRYAPERVTTAQLRHLTRARHLLQALFGYTLPLGPRTSSSATANQSPSTSPENATSLGPRTSSSATTPSPAISAAPSPNAPSSTANPATPSIRQVPEIPMVAGISHVPASPTVDHNPLTPSPASHDSHSSPTSYPSHNPQSATPNSAFRIQHSAFSPFIPDFHTLAQALKADSLPPNCAGALFENPGEALVKALHQLHTIYFSLYPNQSPSPSPSNPQSTIRNPQSNIPQSDAPSVNPVNPVSLVNPVHSVHSPSPAQSEILLPHSDNPQSAIKRSPIIFPRISLHPPHSALFHQPALMAGSRRFHQH